MDFDPTEGAHRAKARLSTQKVAVLVHEPILLYAKQQFMGRIPNKNKRRQGAEDAAILLQHLMFFQRRAVPAKRGWFPHKKKEIYDVTPLTVEREKVARELLIAAGLLETRRQGGHDSGTELEWRLKKAAFDFVDAAIEACGREAQNGNGAEASDGPEGVESHANSPSPKRDHGVESHANSPVESHGNSGVESHGNSPPESHANSPTCSNSRGFDVCREDTHTQPPGDSLGPGPDSVGASGVCVSAYTQNLSPLSKAICEITGIGEIALRNRATRRDLERTEREWRAADMTPDRVKLWLHWFETVNWRDEKTRPNPPKLMHLGKPDRLSQFLDWEEKQAGRGRSAHRNGKNHALKVATEVETEEQRTSREAERARRVERQLAKMTQAAKANGGGNDAGGVREGVRQGPRVPGV